MRETFSVKCPACEGSQESHQVHVDVPSLCCLPSGHGDARCQVLENKIPTHLAMGKGRETSWHLA